METKFLHGTQIGRFRIEAQVGRGGMGVVYRCFDPVLKRPVALKLLAPHLGNDSKALTRFHREATLAASLKHSHIAIVYDFGEYEGQPYIALEWIEGGTLKELLATEGSLSLERSLKLFDQLASALDYAHQGGVIHRDLKPANIMIGPDDVATIVDFGIAWLEEEPTITATGAVVGTPLYMSPEQIQGGAIDGHSDFYSLGVIFYEMLACEPPFGDKIPVALFQQQLDSPPTPISEYNPAVPLRVEKALIKALEQVPANRFATAGGMSHALRPPSSEVALQPSWSPRLRMAFWLLALLLLSLVALVSLNLSRILTTPAISEPPSAAFEDEDQDQDDDAEDEDENENEYQDEGEDIINEFSNYGGQLWPIVAGNPHQTRFVDAESLPFNTEADWRYQAELNEGMGLVAGRGRLVVAQARQVIGLDWTNGDLLWQAKLDEWEVELDKEVTPTPSIYADEEYALLLVPIDSQLYCLNLADGSIIWNMQKEFDGSIVGGVTTISYENTGYAVTDKGWVYAFNPLTRKIDWSLDLSQAEHEFVQPPTATRLALFLVSRLGTIVTIDLATQEVVWTAGMIDEPTTPLVIQENLGLVVVGSKGGWVQAFSIMSGQEVWQSKAQDAIVGLAVSGTTIHTTTADGKLIAWWSPQGEQEWEVALDETPTTAPIINGQIILVGTEAGNIRYIEHHAEQAIEVREHLLTLNGSVVHSPALAKGRLFVRTNEAIYGFGPNEGMVQNR